MIALVASLAHAHGGPEQRIAVTVVDGGLRTKVTAPIAMFPGADADGDGRVSAEEARAAATAIQDRAAGDLDVIDEHGRSAYRVPVDVAPVDGGRALRIHATWTFGHPNGAAFVVYRPIDEHGATLFVRHGQEVEERPLGLDDADRPQRVDGAAELVRDAAAGIGWPHLLGALGLFVLQLVTRRSTRR
ncbi:MAG: hypothetical protein H6738_17930 [Alphaproteobacteria bacterium]|nr:hypothetical protein [Alphaproteobacteria bacterium]MCB9698666.1 hypothetical protein [Alphaproteobacteria bacterium]